MKKPILMRIGIDIRKINDTGIGRYIRSLLKYLFPLDQENKYYLFLNPKEYNQFTFNYPNIYKIKESSGKYSLREHLSLAWKAQHYKLDLFHAPHYVLPLALRAKSIVTIHDVIHLIFPPPTPLGIGYIYARTVMAGAIKKAQMVLTGSVHTKRDLNNLFPKYQEHKIRVTPYGVGEEFVPLERKVVENFLAKKGIPKDFFLYVGDSKPHKNLSTLIEAFSVVARRIDCYLVIAGTTPENHHPLRQKILEYNIAPRVIFPGFIPDPELPFLYNAAQVFVFPSLYEGFGLPPLEAMACNTPVICSQTSSLPEVVGDSAILLPPKEVDLWSDAMYNVFTNKDLQEKMKKKGRARARSFSWEDTARLTFKAYQEILSQP
jgi:glycosyltransferase involved in cell wall biosynthesis